MDYEPEKIDPELERAATRTARILAAAVLFAMVGGIWKGVEMIGAAL